MASTKLVVTVTITKGTRTVSLQSFNLAAILGPSNRFVDPYKVYVDALDMLTDGFLVSDPEYVSAVRLTSQPIVPDKFIVSKYSASIAQVNTFAVNTLVSGHAYHFQLDNVVITYTSGGGDTQQSILAALLTAIGVAFPGGAPVTGAVAGTGGSALLTLTSTVPGVGVSYTAIDADLTLAQTVANHTIVQDIIALQNALLATDQFYGLIVTSHISSDILQIASYVESQLMVYVTASSEAGILTNSTSDVGSVLKLFAYNRMMIMYSASPAAAPDAAWMGYMLPTTPGIGNWKFKTLEGIAADSLDSTQIFNAQGKRVNLYLTIGGNGCTLEGITPGGEFFDVTIFLDWLASTMQSNVFGVLTNSANLKVPYTNKGIGQIENPMNETLQQGQDNQGLAAGWSVFAPDVSKVPKADKKNRVLNNIGFDAELAGAINKVNIKGYVSV